MIDQIQTLRDKVNIRAEQIRNDTHKFVEEMLREIDEVKENMLLFEIKKLYNRLDAIEQRLPPLEEE